MEFTLVYEQEIEFGYTEEKELTRKTLRGFNNALNKLIEERNIAVRYVTPNLKDNELVNSLPDRLW